jgi:hypothetical protein
VPLGGVDALVTRAEEPGVVACKADIITPVEVKPDIYINDMFPEVRKCRV